MIPDPMQHTPMQVHNILAGRNLGKAKCDSCKKPVHTDVNGYWVGADETSDCPASPKGHTVHGRAYG
jgi:hypothetical protein